MCVVTLARGFGCEHYLRNRNRFFARRYTGPGRRALRRDRNRSESAVEPVWARIKPLVAKHNGRGVFVAADGTSAKYKRALEALARRDGVPVVRPPFGARNQHGGQIAALTENHILSSCDMLYPTEESSFFSIALVRAAGRKKVADQYVCGSQQAGRALPVRRRPMFAGLPLQRVLPELSRTRPLHHDADEEH